MAPLFVACGWSPTNIPFGQGASIVNDASAGGTSPSSSLPNYARRTCPESRNPEMMSCDVLVRTNDGENAVEGLVPEDIQSAYRLPSSSRGAGSVVAVVDAYDDPKIESDLNVYRVHFGLPSCTTATGCFRKLNQLGEAGPFPAKTPNWSEEESLDVDMVSAVCPNCKILLIEANSNNATDLGAAVNEAVQLGAHVVSNSYGSTGSLGRFTREIASDFDHKGTVIVAAAGDAGYYGHEDHSPAGFPTVVAVGGTALTRGGGGERGWSEVAWALTGGGCNYYSKPMWQGEGRACQGRLANDVSAVASYDTPVAVYDTDPGTGLPRPWFLAGGTSVATPIIASIYALAGNAADEDAGESLYTKATSLFDVTAGSNGVCRIAVLCIAKRGFDGPTGNGTPDGIGAF